MQAFPAIFRHFPWTKSFSWQFPSSSWSNIAGNLSVLWIKAGTLLGLVGIFWMDLPVWIVKIRRRLTLWIDLKCAIKACRQLWPVCSWVTRWHHLLLGIFWLRFTCSNIIWRFAATFSLSSYLFFAFLSDAPLGPLTLPAVWCGRRYINWDSCANHSHSESIISMCDTECYALGSKCSTACCLILV